MALLSFYRKQYSQVKNFPSDLRISGSIGYRNMGSDVLDSSSASDHLYTHRSNWITLSILQYRIKFWTTEIVPRLWKLSKSVGSFCIRCDLRWAKRAPLVHEQFLRIPHKKRGFWQFFTVPCKYLNNQAQQMAQFYRYISVLEKSFSIIEILPKKYFWVSKVPIVGLAISIHFLHDRW